MIERHDTRAPRRLPLAAIVLVLAATLVAWARAGTPAHGQSAVPGPASPAGVTILARGTTAAGTGYSIGTEPPPPQACDSITIVFAETSAEGEASNAECISGGGAQSLSLSCRHDRRVGIAAIVPARVRTMRLKLASTRTIVSAVVRVPAPTGPLGAYYQALRASAPRPVSLTELGQRSRVLRVLKLPDDRSCLRRSRNGEVVQGSGSVSSAGAQ